MNSDNNSEMGETRIAENAGRPRWRTQRIATAEDLTSIKFVDGVASLDIHVSKLGLLPLKNDVRVDNHRRTKNLVKRIRLFGYNSMQPVIVRVGRRGRWVVVDGGHRLTAARKVAGEFWPNLFGKKVGYIGFLLFRTELSDTLTEVDNPAESDTTVHNGKAAEIGQKQE